MFMYRSRSAATSTNSSAASSLSSSAAFRPMASGWVPARSTLSPAATTTGATATEMEDYFSCKPSAQSSRRDSTSSTTSSSSSSSLSAPSITLSASLPLSPGIAYPSWSRYSDVTTRGTTTLAQPPTTAYFPSQPTSYISDDDLESLDFSPASRRSNWSSGCAMAEPEFKVGAQGISWSATRQTGVVVREERKRRLPPPPPGMMTTVSTSRSRKASKERRKKGLSMIKE